MIGASAITGGLIGLALIVSTLLFLLTALAWGGIVVRSGRRRGWLVVGPAAVAILVLTVWLFSAFHVPEKILDLQLGSPWAHQAGNCIKSGDTQSTCIPVNGHYLLRVTTPDGVVREIRGDELSVTVDSRLHSRQVQIYWRPRPTAAQVDRTLAAVIKEAHSTHYGCNAPDDAPVPAAYRQWLASASGSNCTIVVHHGTYHLIVEMGRFSGELWVLERIRLVDKDPPPNNSFKPRPLRGSATW